MKHLLILLTFIVSLCFSSPVSAAVSDGRALSITLEELILLLDDNEECITCPSFTDYGKLLDDLEATPWFKTAVVNSANSTERGSLFRSWDILTKSESSFAGAGLLSSEDVVQALARDLRGVDGDDLRVFLNTAPDSGIDIVEFRNRVRAWEVLYGDGSGIYQPFRLDIEDLELITDYLKYNPSKLNSLEVSFIGAFNKRSFLNDLRDSGYQYLPIAEEAFLVYDLKLPEAMNALEDLAGDLGVVSGRSKRPESAANRLKRAVDNGWAPDINTVDEAIDNLWDAIGTRIVLNSPDNANSDELVRRIINAIDNGEVDVVSVNSLTGPDGFPYFSQLQLDEISTSTSGGVTVLLNDGYESGYTVVTIFVKYSDGVRGEIQIIGNEVLDLANAEHLVYDAFLNKPYLNAYPSEIQSQVSSMVEPIRNAAQALSSSQRLVYEGYLNSVYKNARRRELSIPEVPVSLPGGYSNVLDFDHLIQIEHAIQQL